MHTFDTNPVDYRATSLRPSWHSLPAALRAHVASRLGEVIGVDVASSGFTPTFAGLVTTGRGRWFLKAAESAGDFGKTIQREARVLAAMPPGLPVPQLQWVIEADGWILLCLNAIDGHMPGHPWTHTDLHAALDAQARLFTGLADPPPPLVDAVADMVFSELADQRMRVWRTGAAGAPIPAAPGWVADHLDELAVLEELLCPATAAHTGVMHLDSRGDNILIHAGDTIVDWNFAMRGPGFADVVMLLMTAFGDADIDALVLVHPVTKQVPAEVVDAVLAASGGMLLDNSQRPAPATSPLLRDHQRGHAAKALTWLATRQGWIS